MKRTGIKGKVVNGIPCFVWFSDASEMWFAIAISTGDLIAWWR